MLNVLDGVFWFSYEALACLVTTQYRTIEYQQYKKDKEYWNFLYCVILMVVLSCQTKVWPLWRWKAASLQISNDLSLLVYKTLKGRAWLRQVRLMSQGSYSAEVWLRQWEDTSCVCATDYGCTWAQGAIIATTAVNQQLGDEMIQH